MLTLQEISALGHHGPTPAKVVRRAAQHGIEANDRRFLLSEVPLELIDLAGPEATDETYRANRRFVLELQDSLAGHAAVTPPPITAVALAKADGDWEVAAIDGRSRLAALRRTGAATALAWLAMADTRTTHTPFPLNHHPTTPVK